MKTSAVLGCLPAPTVGVPGSEASPPDSLSVPAGRGILPATAGTVAAAARSPGSRGGPGWGRVSLRCRACRWRLACPPCPCSFALADDLVAFPAFVDFEDVFEALEGLDMEMATDVDQPV